MDLIMQRCLLILILLMTPLKVFSQADIEPDTSGQELEQLIAPENQVTKEDETPEKPQAPVELIDPKELSDLGKLAPFSDIAVIQKRFLPKTARFEFFPSVGLVLNDVFFFNPILSGRVGYYFTEQYGVEAAFLVMSSSERQVVKDLEKRQVVTEGLVFPNSYYGVDFKWTPVYGKMGFMNNKVVPFDMYFLLGGGLTNTNQKTSPTTIHLGTGQIFALSKWMAFRWDIGGYWFSSKTNVGSSGGGSFMNLHLTLGASFFFPEAKYR